MAGSADPGYNPNIQRFPIPDDDKTTTQLPKMMDWGAPIPKEPDALVVSMTGDAVPAGQPFIRVVSPSGQSDVLDGTV